MGFAVSREALDILVVDDEPGVRTGIAFPLADVGHRVVEASDGAQAMVLLSERVFDVVFCDIRLPKIDGFTLLQRIRRETPSTAVIVMTAFGRVQDAKEALREGVYDYVTKPLDMDDLTQRLITRIQEERALERDRIKARRQLHLLGGSSAIVGRSPAMARLQEQLDTIAHSDAPVLIIGESGTGKELVARELHDRGPRSRGPFVAVNCASVPDTLLEAELFGHERGAFTGALRRRDGRFKLADGGTLLLDEVAEISPAAQTKLLRVLQEGEIDPLGADRPVRVDVRILSATHQDLRARVREGRFREDLYYRLNVLDLHIPPLRERRGDLPLLLEHFFSRLCPMGEEPPRMSARAWRVLSSHPFPGNVRELGHALERAVVLSRRECIDVEHLPSDMLDDKPHPVPDVAQFQPLAAAFLRWERDYLEQALALAGGKKSRTAELLGISRKNLWEKLRAHKIRSRDDDES